MSYQSACLLGQDAEPPLHPHPTLTKRGQRETQSDFAETFGSGGRAGQQAPRQTDDKCPQVT